MVFKDLGGIVHRDGNNRTSGLRGNLQGSVAERKHGQLFAPVACPFREDADGDPVFNINRLPEGLFSDLLLGSYDQGRDNEVFSSRM